jgi:toxic protein SymE
MDNIKAHNSKGIRKLKVYPKFRMAGTLPKVVPEIRLCGKWLLRLGFKAGQTIIVQLETNRITIILDEGSQD